MTAFVNTNMRILVGSGDLAGFASSAEVMVEQDEVDITPLNAGGWRQVIGGLSRHMLSVQGFQSFSAAGPDALVGGTTVGRQAFSVCPQNAGDTIADPCYIGQGWDFTYTPLTGSVGQAAGFNVTFNGDSRPARAQVLHPLAARTATGNGTVTTFTNPGSTQALGASFHVTSVTGSGSIVFTVQTDDAAGFSSPTTRITSQSFTAGGSQFAAAAVGAFSGETHIRTAWTITGFTSVTFFVAAGAA